jgi:hypothetical protein
VIAWLGNDAVLNTLNWLPNWLYIALGALFFGIESNAFEMGYPVRKSETSFHPKRAPPTETNRAVRHRELRPTLCSVNSRGGHVRRVCTTREVG